MPRAGSLALSSPVLSPSLEERGYRLPPATLNDFESAVTRARGRLLDMQNPDGHWVGELQGDTILESEYVLLMAFLGRDDEERVRKAARYILTQERPDGGWSNYPGGPVDLSVTVKAYFALKLAGHDPDASYMRRAREHILDLGGAANCNSFTKCYLASLGQLPYDNCPTVPPELLLLPSWSYVNIHAMSSWTRTIVVPLSIFSAHRPVTSLPPEKGIAELFARDPHIPLWPHPPSKRWFTITNFFIAVDQAIKWFERWGPRSVRQLAVRKAERWMIDHFAGSDGVGAIFPPIIYTIISLRCLGYADDSPEMTYALEQLDNLMIEDEDTLRVQPCFSPVWDTALSINALAMSANQSAWIAEEERNRYAINRGIRWLLQREVRDRGDWSLANPRLEPGGWFFEYRNRFYPDTDDTAMVLMALARSGQAWDGDGRRIPAVERGLCWLLGMQNRDGGWGAFDRNINREVLTKIPFADHNAMLDPSCPDITARALEALGQYGYAPGNRQVDRAIAFLEHTQDGRGCWQGRWGVNYIYGTWQVLIGLQAIGYDMRRPAVQRAVAWLEAVQQSSGAWGESCRSYDDPRLAGQGEATASQTAWALLGLIAAGRADSDAVHAGIRYLVRTQQDDGNWHEDQFTGTGFPKVFYLKYHMYRLYFPFMALAKYQEAGTRSQASGVSDQESGVIAGKVGFSGYKYPA